MKKLSQYFPDVEVLPAYQPAMMANEDGYYSGTVTTSGNAYTVLCRFKIDSFSGNTQKWIAGIRGVSNDYRCAIIVYSNDYSADSSLRGKVSIQGQTAASSNIVYLASNVTIDDGAEHTLFFSYDGTAGTATLIIDGADADDTGFGSRVLTTGTLDVGANTQYISSATTTLYKFTGGAIGFFGYHDAYLTNYSDFFDSSNYPIKQDETTWSNSGFGSQPLAWNEHGDMVNNKGSAGNMTKTGTIIVADQPSTFFGCVPRVPILHQYTVVNGNAEAGDMTGWTASVGTGMEVLNMSTVSGLDPYEGSYSFGGGNQAVMESYQDISLIDGPVTAAVIDSEKLIIEVEYYLANFNVNDCGRCYLKFYDASNALMTDENITPPYGLVGTALTWEQRRSHFYVPFGARTMRLYMGGRRTDGTYCNSHIDAISLTGKIL